jgi:DNA replication and repair protein RecF
MLEAAYMLSTLRSFRESIPLNIIKFGDVAASVEGKVNSFLGLQKMLWSYHRQKKDRLLQIDGKTIHDVKIWFKPLRSILFCPEHIHIIKGSPEMRRQFVDRARFTANPTYLDVFRKYYHVLTQKRELLRKENLKVEELIPWNKQLIDFGTKVTLQRQSILKELKDPFQKMHDFLANGEQVQLQLKGIGSVPKEEVRERLTSMVTRAVQEEIIKKQVLVGPHKDDISILMNNMPARQFASQGQTRTMVIALKLAELEAARLRGENPLFLLDDLTSELDYKRMTKLVQILSDRDGQVWITTTSPNFLGSLPETRLSRFQMNAGEIKQDK